MGGDLGGLLSTALAIVSIATLAGLGLLRGTVTNLRESNTDLRNQLNDLKAERTEDETRNAKLHAESKTRIAQLEADNAALQRVVTGEVHWVALGERLEHAIALITAIRDFLSGTKGK